MDTKSAIYVAGHTGLVGSALVRRLEQEGYENLILVPHKDLDLTSQEAVENFFRSQKPEYVFVAAAKVGGIYANDHFPADFIRENLFIAANIIDAAHKNQVKKLLYLGSSCIYPKLCPQPMKEEHLLTGPMEPTNQWYGIAKAAGIKMAQAFSRQYGFNAISVMPTNLYGPGDNFDLAQSHVLPALLRKFHLAKLAARGDMEAIRRNEKVFGALDPEMKARIFSIAASHGHEVPDNPDIPHPGAVLLWGTGSPLREFLYVDDLADALVFLIDHYEEPGIINVGAGQENTIKEMAEKAREIVGYEGPVVWDTEKPDGSPRKLLDSSRITAMGWRPRTSLESGLYKMFQWYLKKAGEKSEKGVWHA